MELMPDTMQADLPGEGWTLDGLAYCQVAIARDDLMDVAAKIRTGHRSNAVEALSAVIHQLEAARRHLA
ncbi:hypothetical protein [Microbacterium sp.]|uniref:hypothetical protein n=1 Tax=Microbacterium sp. TaxID=51671 RepID=UPI0039E2742B